MVNDLCYISYEEFYGGSNLTFPLLFNQQIVYPITRIEYEMWLEVAEKYAGLDVKSIQNWLLCIDDVVNMEGFRPEDFVDPEKFSTVYFDNIKISERMDASKAFFLSAAQVYVSRTISLASTMPEDKFLLLTGNKDLKTDCKIAGFVTEFFVPDFPLEIGHIDKLRKSDFLPGFIEYIESIRKKGIKDDKIKKELVKEVLAIGVELKPKITDSVIKGIASNLPLPTFLNPFGVVMAYKDIAQQISLKRESGWFFFLSEWQQLRLK